MKEANFQLPLKTNMKHMFFQLNCISQSLLYKIQMKLIQYMHYCISVHSCGAL